jgi:hypothetical protein
MASPVQPGTRSPALDGPPPPSGGPVGPTPGGGGMADVVQGAPGAGGGPGGGGDAQGGRRAIVMMGAEIDRALTSLAQALNQLGMKDGLDGLAQARALIETSIAQSVAGAGEMEGGPPATSPTAAGPQFPGGGSMSGRP